MLQIILTTTIIAIALYGYLVYVIGVVRGDIKPRPMTWLIWGILNTAVSYVQYDHGAGLGVISTALGAISGYILAILAFYYGHRVVHPIDLISIGLVFILLAAWSTIGDVALTLCAGAIFAVGFLPTIDRVLKHPRQERAIVFGLSGVRYILSIAVTGVFAIETIAYPIILASLNLLFVGFLLFRQKKSQKT